jgi:hypothetical protein
MGISIPLRRLYQLFILIFNVTGVRVAVISENVCVIAATENKPAMVYAAARDAVPRFFNRFSAFWI